MTGRYWTYVHARWKSRWHNCSRRIGNSRWPRATQRHFMITIHANALRSIKYARRLL